jgi:hypothetical protein
MNAPLWVPTSTRTLLIFWNPLSTLHTTICFADGAPFAAA